MSFDSINQPTTQRFRTGIEYQKELLALTRNIQQRMLNNLASNYSKDQNTNIAEFFKAVAKEFARLQISSSEVNEYKYHNECKEEYLFQILGDSLFLSGKAINENLSDISYKNFLLKVRNALFKGSTKDNIQFSVSDILGIPIELKEAYLRLRYSDSGYTLKDTHKMFFDIFMDNSDSSVGSILSSIKFFIDLIKPAHVLYDTRLIYQDELKKDIKCKYSYITQGIDYEVYGATSIYVVTYLASRIYKYDGENPLESWQSGTISSIDTTSGIINLTNDIKLVYDEKTVFYLVVSNNYILTDISEFEVGDEIKYYATKDSASSSTIIDSSWAYIGKISEIYPDEEILILSDDSLIVYNKDTLVYTRDKRGEHRIDISELSVNDEIIFKADKYTRSFQFYAIPKEIEDNYYKQFDSSIIEKPLFQGVVKKNKDIPEGLEEGYNVVVENNIATIVNVHSRFYKIENSKTYAERSVYRYTLLINDKFVYQIHGEGDIAYTENEAKEMFIQLGFTELNDPNTNYKIIITKTGLLVEDDYNPTIKSIDNKVFLCDDIASCHLKNLYEDKREYFVWPDVKLCSGFFSINHSFEVLPPIENGYDIQGWFRLSSDPNTYKLPFLPILNKYGKLAEASDLIVFLNGLQIENPIAYLDPIEGIVGLTFIPPFNSTLRVDYYYAERYPTKVNQLKYIRGPNSITDSDLPAILSVISSNNRVPRLTWPFTLSSSFFEETELDYQMNKFPILDRLGNLAKPEDITVELGTIIVSGKLKIIGSTNNSSLLYSIDSSLNNVLPNDIIIINFLDYVTSNYLYTINSVDYLSNRCVVQYGLPVSDTIYSYTIIRFTRVVNAVTEVRPLLGHIKINFVPPTNSVLSFSYYYTYQYRNYCLLSDDISRTSDTFYGVYSKYTMMGDCSCESVDKPVWDFDNLLKNGYRYRAFDLFSSSILDSESLLLDNKQDKIDKYNLTFSGEYLKDSDKNIVLNDVYLKKDIPTETVLNPDIPLFIETYTDKGYYRNHIFANEVNTYNENLPNGMDLRASFNIIEPDNSGIIDYNSICEIKNKERINLYSDLKVVTFSNGGKRVELSSIDEDITSFPFKFIYLDMYYPDREQRINDYLDFINQIPIELYSGKVCVLNGSSVIKSKTVDLRLLSIGDTLVLRNIPFDEFVNGEWIVRYRDADYTILDIIDKETAKINKPFQGKSGEYVYTLKRNRTIAIDIGLAGGYGETGIAYGNINRQVFINNSLGFSYGLPREVALSFPPYRSIDFSDPDPDPIPANPDNPYIANPTVAYYDIEPYNIDGKIYITNRVKGETGIVLTSNIIDEEGRSYGYSGGISGVTGPSGALDLGVTGPIGCPNPFEYKGSDIYVVPSAGNGIHLSHSEAEYRVQWRNFDQSMIIVYFSGSGILEEHVVNQMDDQVVDNILLSFWKVQTQSLFDFRCFGTVIVTSKLEYTNVLATSFPDGLIYLTPDMRLNIKDSIDPVTEYPEYHLNDTRYNLYKMIVRELLPNGLIKVTEFQQLVPIGI